MYKENIQAYLFTLDDSEFGGRYSGYLFTSADGSLMEDIQVRCLHQLMVLNWQIIGSLLTTNDYSVVV